MINRRDFVSGTLALLFGSSSRMALADVAKVLPRTDTMPVLFMGHGSPMNAIEDNDYSRTWRELGARLPRPTAILCVSAHWLTNGVFVSTAEQPETIHDFGGFPKALFDMQYPVPGSPQTARTVQSIFQGDKQFQMSLDPNRGLDHGTWSVLAPMFPQADIPVFQMSINYRQPMDYHYRLANRLNELRDHGVLIVGSGNIVHNLRMTNDSKGGYDWAYEFDEYVRARLLAGDHLGLVNYTRLGSSAQLAVPTPDHYIPMLYGIGLQRKTDQLTFMNESLTAGSMSMRSFMLSKA